MRPEPSVPSALYVGTAGWSIPRGSSPEFDSPGTHLQRYARVLPVAEINSSFYRSHARPTYERWAAATPPKFRFSVKMPREITHERELRAAREPFRRFLSETSGLADHRGPFLIQLPPSLVLSTSVARRFFDMVRSCHSGPIVCEPRHETWFTAKAAELLRDYRVSRAAADPPRGHSGAEPDGWLGFRYFRWHGYPRVYWSPYDIDALTTLAARLQAHACDAETWCVFDNTASGAALLNARQLLALTEPRDVNPAAPPQSSQRRSFSSASSPRRHASLQRRQRRGRR